MMTQLQKIVAKAKSLKKSYPNTKWTDLIKKASKLITPSSKSVAGTKKVVKKSPLRSLHKVTKSHNVNIKVVSGVPDNYSFSFGDAKLYTQKQFTIFGKVELVIFEPNNKKTITVLDGKNTADAVKKLLSYIITSQKSTYYDLDIWEKKLKKLITELNKEISIYNKDIKTPKTVLKKAVVKKYAPVKPLAKKKTLIKKSPVKRSRSAESEKIRSTVKKDGFIMPHGYAVAKAKRVMSGNIGNITIDQIKRNNESIERLDKVILENKAKMKYTPYKTIFWQNYFKKKNQEISDYIKTLKKQNTGLKKHIK